MMIRFLRTIVSPTICAIAATMASAAGQTNSGASGVTAQFRVVSYMNRYGPPHGLTEGFPGILYSDGGGAQEAVFSITTQGSKTVLATFSTGQYITAPPVSAANGRFYSATQLGTNPANVFSVSSAPASKQTYPAQNFLPILTYNLPDGMLLGTAVALASSPWYLVKCDLNGAVTPIYQFPSGEVLPHTAVYASDGNYYGVSALQDASGYVYRVTPSGSLTKLVNFPSGTFNYGAAVYVPLLQASDGNLYGATPFGGANGTGTIYKLTLGGQYTLLYTFPQGPDYNPTALIEGSDGNLYGATWAGNGAGISLLFRVTTSGQYTLLFAMKNLAADGGCQCYLVQGSDGIIYGTALGGGITGAGVVFALDAGLPKPAPQAQHFQPQSGPVGTQVRIWGYNLLSASVEFNGVAATTVSNSGSNYILASIPAGATTGPITVTTPGGSVTTHASFTVE